MTLLTAVLAFLSGASLVLWVWHARRPVRLPFPGRRKPQGTEQDPVLVPALPGYWEGLERSAEAAGLALTRRHFQQAFLLGAGLGLFSLMAGQVLFALAFPALGLMLPRALVDRRRRQRADQFLAQLPQGLFLAATTLKAGGTILQALEAVAGQMPAPLGEEFKTAVQAIKLGTPPAEALSQVHARIGLKEFAGVVLVARVSGELGGNPADTLERVAHSLVDTQTYRRTVKAYTTEGRMSAVLVTALPFIVMGVLTFLSPGYFEPLFQSGPGRALLIVSVLMIATGWVIIRRMTNPEDL